MLKLKPSEQLGRRLKSLRLARNLTQTQIAHLMGYKGAANVHAVESGRIGLTEERIGLLADGLGIPKAKLLEELQGDVDSLLEGVTDVPERLRLLRERAGLTAAQLAKLVGFKTYGGITALETGETRLTVDRLPLIAQALGVDEATILGSEVPSPASPPPGHHPNPVIAETVGIMEKLKEPDQEKVLNHAAKLYKPYTKKIVRVMEPKTKYRTVTATCSVAAAPAPTRGDWSDYNDRRPIQIPADDIPAAHYDHVLLVRGDSMMPKYNDGDAVFVRDADAAAPGAHVIVEIDGRGRFLKSFNEVIDLYGNRSYAFCSLNRDRESIEVTADIAEDLRIVGVVVGKTRPVERGRT